MLPFKRTSSFVACCSAAAALTLFSGCDQKTPTAGGGSGSSSSSGSAGAPGGGVALKAPGASNTSFNEVAAQLDAGGTLFVYLSTQQWLAGLSQKIDPLRELALSAAGNDPKQRADVTKLLQIATDVVKSSGIEELAGVGASSFEVEPGIYRNKMFLHHARGAGKGLIWNLTGRAPRPLTELDLLPANTAAANIIDFDINQLVAFVRRQINAVGDPAISGQFEQVMAGGEMTGGVPLEQLLSSLNGPLGFILTLDPAKNVTVPTPPTQMTVPYPRLALVLAVKDDRIFQQIEKMVGGMPNLVRVDEPELRMRSMPAQPLTPEFTLKATVAQTKQYLIVASDDQLVREILAPAGGGTPKFRQSPEFTKLSNGMPTEGNGFSIATAAYAKLALQLQQTMMQASAAQMEPAQQEMVKKIFSMIPAGSAYSVTTHLENGVLGVTKSPYGAGFMAASIVAIPTALAAGITAGVVEKRAEAKATPATPE